MSPHLILEVAMEMAFPHDFLETLAKNIGAEKTRECAMSTSVGGIGPLLKERVIEQGEAGLDVVGVSLLYDTVWIQAWHEWGQINLEKRRVGPDLRKFLKATDLGFQHTFFDGKTIEVAVWELAYGRAKVYFLDAPPITEVVYPGPKDMPLLHGSTNPYGWAHEVRMKQSWLVGRGALWLSKKMNRRPDVVILSETPTFFAHPRLIQDELQNDAFFSNTSFIFNDHTPLEYAHPIWDQHTLEMVKLDPAVYLNATAWNPVKKTLDVTSLLVAACDGVYGVAKKHGEVMKAMPSLREFGNKIKYVTNGVRQADWQAPELTNFEKMTDAELLAAKRKRKQRLLDWAWRHCRLWPSWASESIDRNVIVWTRRITPYKRLDILVKLLKNADWRARFLKTNVVLFVGGRIHQQDNHAQDIVYELLELLGKDKEVQTRVLTVDNFNIYEAPILYQGADASVMMADDTREASATGFMKAQMNGGAIIATLDGAVPEFVNQTNGFFVPYVNGEPTPLGLLEAVEAFDRACSQPVQKAAMIRAALAVTPQVSVKRTVEEMKQLYADVSKEAQPTR